MSSTQKTSRYVYTSSNCPDGGKASMYVLPPSLTPLPHWEEKNDGELLEGDSFEQVSPISGSQPQTQPSIMHWSLSLPCSLVLPLALQVRGTSNLVEKSQKLV